MKNLNLFILIVLFNCSVWAAKPVTHSLIDSDKQTPNESAQQLFGAVKAAVTEQKIRGPAIDSNFGHAVSLDGNRAVIGAKGFNSDRGVVFIYDYSAGNWSKTATLIPFTSRAGDLFGFSVSLSGDRALVAAYGENNSQGAVYIYDYNGVSWSQTVRLVAIDGIAGDQFGYSVSLMGDRALIGASEDDNGKGSAYVFDLISGSWVQTDHLTADVRYSNAQFGNSVSLGKNRAAIGSMIKDSVANSSGTAYIFDLDTAGDWSQTVQLVADDGGSGDDRFGSSLSLSGDRILIGAKLSDQSINVSQSGSAFIFDISTTTGLWEQTVELEAPDAATNDRFGSSVSLSGDRALIGVPRDDANGLSDSGSAYHYTLFAGQWTLQETISVLPPESFIDDKLGIAVSLSGERALVGASQDDTSASNAGAVYVFSLDPLLYVVGGVVTGLASGNTIELENNGTDGIFLGNGSFNFSTGLIESSAYSVTVKTSPTSPNQTCAITGGSSNDGSGILSNVDYSDIVVSCFYICETLQSGNWGDASSWTNCNSTIPQDDDSVIINSGHTVSLNQDTSNLSGIEIQTGGDLNVAASASGYTINGNANLSNAHFDLRNAAIDLASDLTINANAHNILLGSVDGGFGLTLNSSAETRLIGTIGGSTALSSVTTDAPGNTIFANVNGAENTGTLFVAGDRIFNDPVLLAEYANIQGNGGLITFNSTLNSETSSARSLTIANAGNTTITFNGKVGAINRPEAIQTLNSTSSTTVFNTSEVLTKRFQRWGTDIELNSSTNKLLMNVSIGGTIKIGSSNGTNSLRSSVDGQQSLTLETNDVVSVFSPVGDNNLALDDFSIESTSTMLIYNDISVAGTQSYIGPLALAGNSQLTARALDFRDAVDNAGFDLTLAPEVEVINVGVVFSGSGDLIKQGAGLFDVRTVTALTGDVFINQGSINNKTSLQSVFPNVSNIYLNSGTTSRIGHKITGIFNLANGQTLAGTGICDCILSAQSGSIVSPGFSPGVLQVSSSIQMKTGSMLNIELNGTTEGTEYDVLQVINGVGFNLDADNMGGTTLNLSIANGFFPKLGDQFSILTLISSSMITGAFNGLAEGDVFEVDGIKFSISYEGQIGVTDVKFAFLTVVNQQCESLTSGDWSNAGTWTNCRNSIPQDGDWVLINSGHNVNINQNTALLEGISVAVGGDLEVGAGSFTLSADASGADIDLQNTSIALSGDLTIDANAHNIKLGAVDGGFGVTLNSSVETRLLGAIGATTPLSSLTTDSLGTTVFADTSASVELNNHNPNMIVDGPIAFHGPILVAKFIYISGNSDSIIFDSTIDSEAGNVFFLINFVQNANIEFNGDVGTIQRLSAIVIINSETSTVHLNAANYQATKSLSWRTNVVLGAPDITLNTNEPGIVQDNYVIMLGNSSTNYLHSQVAGGSSLTIEAIGTTYLNAVIGGDNLPLANLSINQSASIVLKSSAISVTDTITMAVPVTMTATSVLDANIIDIQSTVDNGGFDLTVDTTDTNNLSQINGVLSGAGSLNKEGAGSFSISAVTTLTGDIYINQGTFNNSTGSQSVFPNVSNIYLGSGTTSSLGQQITRVFNLANGQTLAGAGFCDCILSAQSGSIVSPGFSPGLLAVESSISMDTGSILNIELNGTIQGTDYDHLVVLNGGEFNLDSNSLGGATLNVSLGNGFIPELGDTFEIAALNSSSLITGTFNGLAEGDIFEVNGIEFSISYAGGTNLVSSTVVLTVQSQQCESLTSGDWSNAGTWTNCSNGIPQDGDMVLINSTHAVNLDQNTALLEGLSVTAGGDLNIGAGGFTLFADAQGADFNLQNASIVLSGDLTIDANGHNIKLGAVDGAFGLTLNSTAETRFLGIVGGITQLVSLITDAGGTTVFADTHGAINDQNIVVKGLREFNDPVLLATTTNIAGNSGSITFNSTVNSETTTAQFLFISLAQQANITFNDDVGLINELSGLNTSNLNNSTLTLNLDHFNTTGDQRWRVDLLLNSPTDEVSLSSSSGGVIFFDDSKYIRSVNPTEEDLSISTTGVVTLNATIGDNNQSLSNLSINNSSNIELKSSSISVDNTITFGAAVAMTGASVLEASIVEIKSSIDNGGFDLTIDTSDTTQQSQIDGVLSGAGNLIKNGVGDVSFFSINTMTGNILLNQGQLKNQISSDAIFPDVPVLSLEAGSIAFLGDNPTGDYVVGNNQSIIGDGIFAGNLITQSGAIVSPGFGPGRLLVDEINMDTGSILSIEINGNVVTTEYDQLQLDQGGSLNVDSLGGSTLDISIGFNPIIGDTFKIISSGSTLLGNFIGLPEGAQFYVGFKEFSISYVAGGGNDVVLTFLGSTLHVNKNAEPMGNGLTWGTAFDNLQDALAVAVSGDEVWVAQGVYYPDVGDLQTEDDETATFTLIDGVSIYGGFNATETEVNQRDPDTNVTILSGDISQDDTDTDGNLIAETIDDLIGLNSYHIVTGSAVDTNTLIDGFTITAGQALGIGTEQDNGAGMYCGNDTSGPSINQVTFIANEADGHGSATFGCSQLVTNSSFFNNYSGDFAGAVYAVGGIYDAVVFSGNSALSNGGALRNTNQPITIKNASFIANESLNTNGGALYSRADVELENVLFRGNDTGINLIGKGGALFFKGAITATLTNVTITGNKAGNLGGAIHQSITATLNLRNSIIWNNHDRTANTTATSSINVNGGVYNQSNSLVQNFGTGGNGNLDEDPLFITATDPTTSPTSVGNAHLNINSPAIETGNNSVVTSLTDLDGNPRITDNTVDMGAYAFNSYGVEMTVSGLDAGTLVLQNNGGDDLTFSNNGSDDFSTAMANTATYLVTVLSQPTQPNQECIITNSSGTINNAGVVINVECTTLQYTVGVDVSGLADGVILSLLNNASDEIEITNDGLFVFPTALDDLNAFAVTVNSNPTNPNQTCVVTGGNSGLDDGTGALAGADYSGIVVTCTTNTYSIGGTVSGLNSGNQLRLRYIDGVSLNIIEDLLLTQNADYTFNSAITDHGEYQVEIIGQPVNQTCVLSNGSGTINGANVTNINAICRDYIYKVGGELFGLGAGSISLKNNSDDEIVLAGNGVFQFPTAIADQADYSVSISVQPTNPEQTCVVTGGNSGLNNGTGTLNTADDNSIVVTCTTNQYFIGGVVSGLANGNSVLLSLGAEDLTVNSNAAFVFLNPLTDESSYTVSVSSQPTSPNQTCNLVNPTGIIAGNDITDMQVNCTTNQYMIGGTVTGLHSGNNLLIQNNSGDDLMVSSDGDFDFVTDIEDLQNYNVSILNQPSDPVQACVISNNTGNVAGSHVTTVSIVCAFGDDLIYRGGFE